MELEKKKENTSGEWRLEFEEICKRKIADRCDGSWWGYNELLVFIKKEKEKSYKEGLNKK